MIEESKNIVERIITEDEWVEQMRKNCLSSNPPISLKACLEVANVMGWLISGGDANIDSIEVDFTMKEKGIDENEELQEVDNE